MDTTTYKYSVKQTIFAISLFLVLITWGVYEIETDAPDDIFGKIMIGFTVLFAIFLLYICYKYLLPLLRGETILELDNEKLQYNVSNITVYWKDIASINYTTGSRSSSWTIRFYMKDGSRTRNMPTVYIAGPNMIIYNTVIEYFEKYK